VLSVNAEERLKDLAQNIHLAHSVYRSTLTDFADYLKFITQLSVGLYTTQHEKKINNVITTITRFSTTVLLIPSSTNMNSEEWFQKTSIFYSERKKI
jgi:hypothetical protein